MNSKLRQVRRAARKSNVLNGGRRAVPASLLALVAWVGLINGSGTIHLKVNNTSVVVSWSQAETV